MKKIAVLLLFAPLVALAQWNPQDRNWTSGSLAVPQAGSTTLLTIKPAAAAPRPKRIMLHCVVTGQALGAFVIKGTALGGVLQTLYSTAADYTTPRGLLIGTSGDLTAVAAGSTGWLIMETTGLDQVQVSASSGNAGGSTVNCVASGSE